MGCLQLTYEPKLKIIRSHEAKSVQLWLSVDPLAEKFPGWSPYNYTMQNPINLIDPTGMSAEDPSDPPKYKFQDCNCFSKEPITPKYSFRIGNTLGPYGDNSSTSVFALIGGKTYYNSDTSNNGGFPKLDEPNAFFQAQFRVGGENSNYQIGLNWFKEKYNGTGSDNFGYEAPTAVQVSFGINNLNVISNGKLSITTNLSFAAGIELGMPRSDNSQDGNGTETFNFKPILNKYGLIGYGASAIYRADASYKGFNVFAAATLHGMQTSPVSSNLTTHSGETNVSIGLRVGVGFNFGK
jgi:hypothetical protein